MGKREVYTDNNMLREERGEKEVGGHDNGSYDEEKKESVNERQMGRGVVLACCPTTQTLGMTHTVCHCVCLEM